MQKWVVVDDKYLNYLREFESRIPISDYGANKYKPFFGALFTVGDLVYITQVSHPQPRHLNMRDALDFHKIYLPNKSSTQPDRLVAVVNLNYMFPMPKVMLKFLDYADIDQYHSFVSSAEKSKYINLLQKELAGINKSKLKDRAFRLYQLKLNYPDDRVSKRCIDFRALEQNAYAYLLKSGVLPPEV